jgi:hypothetical protein
MVARLLRSIEAVEAKAAAAGSGSLRRAYLDLADHYRSRLRTFHWPRA